MTAGDHGPVRIALIGAGMIGRKHAVLLRDVPDGALVAVADPAPAGRALADEQGVPHFDDHAAMLDRVRPDGVIVATPNALHVPMGLDCIARGLPLLVEKPLADRHEDAAKLVAAAEAAGVPLLVGHHRRHNPILETARAIVRDGRLGRVTAVTALSLLRKPDAYFDTAWRREPGGGPVLINLIHNIDDLRFMVGEIASLQAMASHATRGLPVEDTAAVTLRFAGGALGTALVSDAVAAPWAWELTAGENDFFPPAQDEACYLLAGTAGSLAVPRMLLWRHAGGGAWQDRLAAERVPVPKGDAYVRQLVHFCRVIRGEETPRVSGADALRTLAAIQAVHRAAASGMVVTLA